MAHATSASEATLAHQISTNHSTRWRSGGVSRASGGDVVLRSQRLDRCRFEPVAAAQADESGTLGRLVVGDVTR